MRSLGRGSRQMEQKLRFPDATSNVSHATKSKSRLRLPTAAAEGESVGEEESERREFVVGAENVPVT